MQSAINKALIVLTAVILATIGGLPSFPGVKVSTFIFSNEQLFQINLCWFFCCRLVPLQVKISLDLSVSVSVDGRAA